MGKEFDDVVLECAGRASQEMTNKGFRSVFQHILQSSHRGPKIYTLWMNLESGEMKLTCSFETRTDVFGVTAESLKDYRIAVKTAEALIDKDGEI